MKRLALIIDGNHFMHTTLTAVGAFSGKKSIFHSNSSDEERRKDINAFLDRLSTILAKDIRNFNALIDEIVITLDDSMSWRKDLRLDNEYKGIPSELEYKGNRVKDKTIDWNTIYSTFKHFLENLEKNSGIRYKSINGCEGDDLMAVFASYYNSKGKSVIIYSGDNDLKQCVSFNKASNCFTAQYKKQEKTFNVDKQTAHYLKENKDTPVVDYLKSFCNNATSKIKVVNPIEVILEKVVMGDDGDNIKAVLSEIATYKSGKKAGTQYERRITPSIYKKVLERMDFSSITRDSFYNKDFLEEVARKSILKFNANKKPLVSDIINNLELNTKLVILDYRSIPHYLYDKIIDWVEERFNEKVLIEQKKLSYAKNLLEFFPLYDKRLADSASSASIFKHLGL